MNMKQQLSEIRKVLKENNKTILAIFTSIVLADIFMIPGSSDIRTYGLLAAYAIDSSVVKRKSKTTFFGSLVLLTVMYASYLLTGPSPQTEKAAVWLFLFLLIGVIQLWRE